MVFIRLESDGNSDGYFWFNGFLFCVREVDGSGDPTQGVTCFQVMGWVLHVNIKCRGIFLSMQRVGGLLDVLAA